MSIILRILNHLPNISSKLFSWIIYTLLDSRYFASYFRQKERKVLHRLKRLEKILVVSDVNIGDSVNIQPAVEALRYYFDDCKIDYVYNAEAGPLISGNPAISNFFPVFINGTVFSWKNKIAVHRILNKNNYDLIINFCPFLSKKDFKNSGCPVIIPLSLIVEILKAVKQKNATANLAVNIAGYITWLVLNLPEGIKPQKKKYQYTGNKVYLSASVVNKRDSFLDYVGVSTEDATVFFNMATSNCYTFIKPDLQKRLIIRLLESPNIDFILLGTGFNAKEMKTGIIKETSSQLREKIVFIPGGLPLDLYASIVDRSSVYITGDTGPMHIAAARKVSVDKDLSFRNRTMVVGIFGATEPSIYGYDSFKTECFGANQNMPSKIFEAQPPCKNITCTVQRITKTCSGKNCFHNIDIDEIAAYIISYIVATKKKRSKKSLYNYVF